jgi:lipopolysaccharide biosynthesis glycosyltransferase
MMSSTASAINVAMAIDDRYAMPMAIAVRSLLRSLEPGWSVQLWIVNDGIQIENIRKCMESWKGFSIQVNWLVPPSIQIATLPVTASLPIATYYRLFLPDLIPSVSKVLYLDVDILVRKSIHHLWETDLESCPIAAAQDLACPWIHFHSVMENYRLAYRYLLRREPIPNYLDLGLPADAPYFNAGVMVMALDRWREEGLSRRLLEFTSAHAATNVSADQYSLNACLWNRRKEIDIRWNQLQAIHNMPGWRESPFDAESFFTYRDEAWIAHFAGPSKPWEASSRHPLRHEYVQVLNETAWAGWRPEPEKLSNSRRVRKGWRVARDWCSVRARRLGLHI